MTGKTQSEALEALLVEALGLKKDIDDEKRPSLKFPKRTLSNVLFEDGYLKLGDKTSKRTLNYQTIRTFAQMLRIMALAKDACEQGEEITKREAYYVSKNWEKAAFDDQNRSDAIIEDLEGLFGVNREQLGFVPEEKGGDVAGNLLVKDVDPRTGNEFEIDCSQFGRGAYSIPVSPELLEFETDAEFILAIETAGMFQRLNAHFFWDEANCILVSMGGVPTRACRRFIRILSESQDIPVYGFTDGDPWGITNIYRTLKVGSGNAAHINKYFCVPTASFLGVSPYDIEEYDLPTHPMNEKDKKKINDALANDPFFKSSEEWKKALKKLLSLGVRVEQQAFAKYGLNFVIEEYLPQKLDNVQGFLP